MPKCIIVGAGIGGLATAIRLQLKCFQVEVFDSSDKPGGKINELRKDGFRWDMGPSLFTLPHLLEELFELSGKNPKDYFSYTNLEVITKYFYEDGTVLSAFQDVNLFANELNKTIGEPKENVLDFLKSVKDNYDFTNPIFLENSFRDFYKNLSPSLLNNIKQFLKLNTFQTMANRNAKIFKQEKTAQLFNRYATYNGSNPFKAPATLNIIAHLEHNLGAYFLTEGMYHITKAVYQLALDLGVKFTFNQKVSAILVKNNKAVGVKVNDFEHFSDIIVSNADVTTTYQNLMPNVSTPNLYVNQEKSSSALVFYWGVSKTFSDLELHNILFSGDYKYEFKALSEGTVSNDPTIYLYISSKQNASDAPEGKENWFVMINVPYNSGQDWNEITVRSRKNITSRLSKQLNQDVSQFIETETILTPLDIESRTSSASGALYGNSSNNMFSAFLRHPNRSKVKGLYFVGGSVHPGGGIPLCLLSAKITSELIHV